MNPKIELFNDTGSSEEERTLLVAIKDLSRFKPNLQLDHYEGNFISALKNKMGNPNNIDLDRFINLAYTKEQFSYATQKIVLLNEPLYQNDRLMDGLTRQRTPQFNCHSYQQTIILSNARNLSQDEFYAVCSHELGHAYGATNRRHDITSDDKRHCTINKCVMRYPAFNNLTSLRRKQGLSVYCPKCEDGIKNF